MIETEGDLLKQKETDRHQRHPQNQPVAGRQFELTDAGLDIPVDARPLTRMIARAFDAYDLSKAGHSSAI